MEAAGRGHFDSRLLYDATSDAKRIERLVLEGLEVALHLINDYVFKCGPNRIIDILEQILPTSYYVNTAYWPFYQTQYGHSACVCRRFNIPCIHTNRCVTWINLETEVDDVYCFKVKNVFITLINTCVNVLFPKGDKTRVPRKFKIMIKFKVKQQWFNGQFDEQRILHNTFICVLRCRMYEAQMCSDNFTFCFRPHPIYSNLYGQYFPLLHNYRFFRSPHYYLDNIVCVNHTMQVVSAHSGEYFLLILSGNKENYGEESDSNEEFDDDEYPEVTSTTID